MLVLIQNVGISKPGYARSGAHREPKRESQAEISFSKTVPVVISTFHLINVEFSLALQIRSLVNIHY